MRGSFRAERVAGGAGTPKLGATRAVTGWYRFTILGRLNACARTSNCCLSLIGKIRERLISALMASGDWILFAPRLP